MPPVEVLNAAVASAAGFLNNEAGFGIGNPETISMIVAGNPAPVTMLCNDIL
jgi:hypothetical protein